MRIVAILCLLLAMSAHQPAGSAPAQNPPAQNPPAQPDPPAVRWEYQVKGNPFRRTDKWLSEKSDEGWELVAVYSLNNILQFVFRRPRR